MEGLSAGHLHTQYLQRPANATSFTVWYPLLVRTSPAGCCRLGQCDLLFSLHALSWRAWHAPPWAVESCATKASAETICHLSGSHMALFWTGSRAEGRTVVLGLSYWEGFGFFVLLFSCFVFKTGFLFLPLVVLELGIPAWP